MNDLINRQDVIDILLFSKEFLMKILDETDVVGNSRDKYSWGLGLVDSHIHDIEKLQSAEPEIIRCKDCKYAHLTYNGSCKYCDKWVDEDDIPLTVYLDGDFYCGFAERRTDE